MSEVRHTRTRPAPAEEAPAPRVRRTRPAEPEAPHPRVVYVEPEPPLLGFGQDAVVDIVLRVRCNITKGNIQRGDLENWFRAAMHKHYDDTDGVVGYGKLASISRPICARIDKPRE